MKVAAMIAGLPRFSKEFDVQLANLQGASEIDWYFTLWPTTTDQYTSPIWNTNDPNRVAELIQQRLPAGHKAVVVQVLPQPVYPVPEWELNLTEWSQPERIWAMYYGLLKVNMLRLMVQKQFNLSYDLVIRTRPDITINETIDLRQVKDYLNTNPNSVIMPQDGRTGINIENDKAINDQFGIALPDVMTTYCNCFYRIYEYNNSGYAFQAETLLATHLKKNNIDYPMTRFTQSIRVFKKDDGTQEFGRWG